jgi:Protein of unknown function (DUF692)
MINDHFAHEPLFPHGGKNVCSAALAWPPRGSNGRSLGRRSQAGTRRRHPRRTARRRILRDSRRELHGRRRPPHRRLEAVRAPYPLSLHGVGLSIGSPRPLDRQHLMRLAALANRYEPFLFSEHLAWSTHDRGFLNDLLPLPYTEETLAVVCPHIDEAQGAVGRRMLLENPSTYVRFAESSIPETEFLAEIAGRTGCGLLLDVNNVEVSATYHGFNATAYLDAFPCGLVGEIHLAGYAEAQDEAGHRPLTSSAPSSRRRTSLICPTLRCSKCLARLFLRPRKGKRPSPSGSTNRIATIGDHVPFYEFSTETPARALAPLIKLAGRGSSQPSCSRCGRTLDDIPAAPNASNASSSCFFQA